MNLRSVSLWACRVGLVGAVRSDNQPLCDDTLEQVLCEMQRSRMADADQQVKEFVRVESQTHWAQKGNIDYGVNYSNDVKRHHDHWKREITSFRDLAMHPMKERFNRIERYYLVFQQSLFHAWRNVLWNFNSGVMLEWTYAKSHYREAQEDFPGVVEVNLHRDSWSNVDKKISRFSTTLDILGRDSPAPDALHQALVKVAHLGATCLTIEQWIITYRHCWEHWSWVGEAYPNAPERSISAFQQKSIRLLDAWPDILD